MKTQVTVDSAGRVLIPKALREELRLRAGDVLDLESEGGDISLRTQQPEVRLVKKRGMWVLSTGEPATIDVVELIRQQREERTRHILGLGPE